MFFSSRFTRDYLDNSFEFNTYDDWYLIPTSRPCIQPPKPKQTVVDVPGANGMADLSRSLTGYPVFMNRTGTNEYMIENDRWPKWIDAQTEVMNKLDGQYLKMYFEDDEPEYYYIGTWTVDQYNPGEIYSTITIGYDLFPYKMKDYYSGHDQPWDTFNFNNDYIMVDISSNWSMLNARVSQGESATLFSSRNSIVADNLVGFFGEMPTYPKIDISPASGVNSWRIKLLFNNSELGISDAEKVIEGSTGTISIDIPEFVMTMMNPQKMAGGSLPEQKLDLNVYGLEGTVGVHVSFKTGRL